MYLKKVCLSSFLYAKYCSRIYIISVLHFFTIIFHIYLGSLIFCCSRHLWLLSQAEVDLFIKTDTEFDTGLKYIY